MDKEAERKATAGIKALAKLSPEEREHIYKRLREKGASKKSIEDVKQLIDAKNEIARWFKR